MDEARRFLRYLIPGTVFFIELLLFLFAMLPDLTRQYLKELIATKDLGSALAFLVTSGTVGFLLSMVHHVLYWSWPFRLRRLYPAADYREFFEQHDRLIPDEDKLPVIPNDNQRLWAAWLVSSKLWHERLKTNPKIEGAHAPTDRLASLTHSLGACRIACCSALLLALAVLINEWLKHRLMRSDEWPLAIVMLLIAVAVFVFCEFGYRQTLRTWQEFAGRVLESALRDEALDI